MMFIYSNYGEGVMKVVWSLILTVVFSIFISNSIVFAGEDQKQSEVFDLGDVLVLEKGGDVSQVTTTNTISIEDIEQTGASNAADALEQIAGIDVTSHSKGGPSLTMRGFDQKDVKVLIDGVPAYESYFGSLDLGQIPVDSIAKIEVIKGASSVLYGANTMGGVINIITKKGGKEPFTKITTSFGENNTRNYSLNHGWGIGKFNYWITYSERESDGWDVSDDFDPANPESGLGTEYNEDGGTRDLSYYDNQTVNAKIGYDFDTNSKVYLSFDYHHNERGCPTFGERYWEYDHWDQWHLNLVGETDITDNIIVKGRLFYVDHEDGLTDVSWDASHTTDPFSRWFAKSSYDDHSQGGDFQTYFNLGEKNLLKIGATFVEDVHTQQDFYDSLSRPVWQFGEPVGYAPKETYEAITYTLAVEDEHKLLDDKLTLMGGISYDVYSPQEAHDQPVPSKVDTVNPQFGAVYSISESWDVHGSISKKTRFPTLSELYSDTAGGNPNLKAQEAVSYEIGMSKKLNDDLKTSFALFYNDVENRIVRERNAANDWVYVNKGDTVLKGLEFEIDYVTGFGLEIGLDYTYTYAKERADSDSPALESSNIPLHKATIDARYMFEFGLTASMQGVFTSRQYEYDNAGVKSRIDDFAVYNARLAQKLPVFYGITPELFLEAKNIFDKNYDEGNGPTAGRSLLLGASVTF
jgi:outer membrane cobalamin receptor